MAALATVTLASSRHGSDALFISREMRLHHSFLLDLLYRRLGTSSADLVSLLAVCNSSVCGSWLTRFIARLMKAFVSKGIAVAAATRRVYHATRDAISVRGVLVLDDITYHHFTFTADHRTTFDTAMIRYDLSVALLRLSRGRAAIACSLFLPPQQTISVADAVAAHRRLIYAVWRRRGTATCRACREGGALP